MDKSILSRFTSAQLRRAADLRDKIETLENELAQMFGVPERVGVSTVLKKKRTMSAAARKKIGAAKKAYWAKLRAAKKK